MLRPSALKYKSLKKQVFLRGIQLLGWAKRMVFHATDEEEATDVRNVFGQAQPVIIGPNLPKPIPETVPPELHKVAGKLKMIFVARVVPIKNLDLVLSALKEVHQEILLSVVGPAEDKPYLQTMQELVLTLPANVQIDFKGAFPAVEIEHMLASHHVFILPTQGENFGHAIFEALQAGTPVIISDQTPWKGLLDHHAGMDLSLDKPEDFADAIRLFADMDQRTYNLWSKGAFDFALNFMHQSDYLAAYQRLFARP
jgi:glycosyltransferase involved in cell wall biosynthesis